jgi:DNA topoisomerase-3
MIQERNTQMKLIIAEKPSVAHSIAAALGANEKKDGCYFGGGYIVSWCVGHLVELAPADAYDEKYAKWRYADLPIVPKAWQYVIAKGREKQLEILRGLMNGKDTEQVICATDAGRENTDQTGRSSALHRARGCLNHKKSRVFLHIHQML